MYLGGLGGCTGVLAKSFHAPSLDQMQESITERGADMWASGERRLVAAGKKK